MRGLFNSLLFAWHIKSA